MNGARRYDHPLRKRGRAADDRIVRREIERFERIRIQRRQRSEVALGTRNAIEVRDRYALWIDEIAGLARVEERGVDGGFRICPRDVREDPLGAAALIEVIVNEGYARYGAVTPGATARGSTSAIAGDFR